MIRMSLALFGVVVSVAACADSGAGATSGAPSAKSSASAPTSAKPSASVATSATATSEPSAAPSASAAAGEKKTFSCDAAATQNVCVEYVGKDHGDETKVKALCDDAKLKGTLSTKPCAKEGTLGMCTTDAGGGGEANTYVYEKGAKTLKAADAKKTHCAVGDWADLK